MSFKDGQYLLIHIMNYSLTYEGSGSVAVVVTSVLDGEGEGVQARAVQEVRQSVHETERYHRVQAQRYPPRPMSSARVVTQHHGHQ